MAYRFSLLVLPFTAEKASKVRRCEFVKILFCVLDYHVLHLQKHVA